jgi:hypothetical protein
MIKPLSLHSLSLSLSFRSVTSSLQQQQRLLAGGLLLLRMLTVNSLTNERQDAPTLLWMDVQWIIVSWLW